MAIRIFAVVALIALVAGVNGAAPAAAQATQASPSREAVQVAQELTSVVNAATTAELMKSINEKLWPSLEAAIRKQHPGADAATIGELRGEVERLQIGAVQETLSDAAAIYARHLSVPEMLAIIAFYRSPAGAKSLAILPAVQVELAKVMVPRMQGLQAKLTLAYLDILQRKGLAPRQ